MALELDDTQAAVLLALLGLPEDATDVQLVIDTVQDATRDPMLPPADAKRAYSTRMHFKDAAKANSNTPQVKEIHATPSGRLGATVAAAAETENRLEERK